MAYILGIHIGHSTSICLMQDGKIIASVQEEKFNHIKNAGGFPKQSIDWLLRAYSLAPEQFDAVAVGSHAIIPFPIESSKPPELPGMAEHERGSVSFPTRVWRHIDYKHQNMRKLFFPLVVNKRETSFKAGRELLKKMLKSIYGIPFEKVHFHKHHTCHAYAAYYGLLAPEAAKQAAVITIDGEGDYESATVSAASEEGGNARLTQIASTPFYKSLGYVYSQTTQFLGMKALEHEYKVMGLAPYAKNYFKATYERLFKPLIGVDEKTLEFTCKFPLNRTLDYLKENATCERFDNIAAAVQHLAEEVTTKLVAASLKKTNANSIYLGGGVFMNVKLNLKLAEMEQVAQVHPFPSCGDESTAMGACYYEYIHNFGKKPQETQRVKGLYLGPEYTNQYVEEMIKRTDLRHRYMVEYYSDMEGTIAELLVKKKNVARLAGKGEWGARSLGNRAILGNPSDRETFYKINNQIKMRDFWMPFAPTILKEREADYIENPKGIEAPYMIMAFHSTQRAQTELVAAIHQADKTCRPQVLEKGWNPAYYKIIKEFENETGIGGVLNTSFNLHGEPMVCSPEDAVHTMDNSGLEYLAIENYLISRN